MVKRNRLALGPLVIEDRWTKGVKATVMIVCMNEPPIIDESTRHHQTTFEACESLIFCLNDRRFVVVRKDSWSSLRPIDGDAIGADSVDRVPINKEWPRIGRLQVGDEVFYKGEKAVIRAVDRYR